MKCTLNVVCLLQKCLKNSTSRIEKTYGWQRKLVQSAQKNQSKHLPTRLKTLIFIFYKCYRHFVNANNLLTRIFTT